MAVLEVTTEMAVLERLLSLAGKDVLDVGCGSGALVRDLCARDARGVGIEISEEQLAHAHARDPGHIGRYRVGRAESLPAADGSVDVVVFMRSLHHVAVDQMMGALAEARRVLRPGGAVYVAEPVADGAFFALVSLIEDEQVVRAAAQMTIERGGEVGLRRTTTLEYTVEARYADVDAFRAHMVSVDPSRARRFTEREREITAAFERLGQSGPNAGERRFHQTMRADVLRPEEQRG